MEHGSGNSGRKPSWLTGRGILIAVIFLLGLGIFLYPHICDWYYQYQFNKAIAAYDRFQGIDCEGMIQAAREYNERLAKKEEQFLVPAEEREELDHLLDPWGTGMMGYVDIPKIGVHIPIYHGTEERALQSGAGFWYGTRVSAKRSPQPMRRQLTLAHILRSAGRELTISPASACSTPDLQANGEHTPAPQLRRQNRDVIP